MLRSEVGEHVDASGDQAASRANVVSSWGSLRAIGHLDRQRVARPHVSGAAPPSRVGLIDQFQLDTPRIEAVVRDHETQTPDQHRLATGPMSEAAQDFGELAEGIDVGGP